MSLLRVGVSGALGNMGTETVRAIQGAADLELVLKTDRDDDLGAALVNKRPDALVDFSVPDAVLANIRTSLSQRVVPIVGTTGLSSVDLDTVRGWCSEFATGALIAPNFAIGAILMMEFSRRAAQFMPDVEIIEMHHQNKVDAPSGTATKTAEMVAEGRRSARPAPLPANAFEKIPGSRGGRASGDVPVHSVRLPGFVASQMVIFGGLGQTLTIRHDSLNRESFMPGVLLAVRKAPELAANGGELIYGLENLL